MLAEVCPRMQACSGEQIHMHQRSDQPITPYQPARYRILLLRRGQTVQGRDLRYRWLVTCQPQNTSNCVDTCAHTHFSRCQRKCWPQKADSKRGAYVLAVIAVDPSSLGTRQARILVELYSNALCTSVITCYSSLARPAQNDHWQGRPSCVNAASF